MIVYLGLGSNTGDRLKNLNAAVCRLENISGIQVLKVSPVYETVPVGGPEQPDYLNAVVGIETELKAAELLASCLGIEKDMGRTGTVRYGPRNIDIDIEFYGQDIIETTELTVPHPRMHERAFVLRPLSDIDPDFVHPVLRLTVKELLACVEDSGVKNYEFGIMNGEL